MSDRYTGASELLLADFDLVMDAYDAVLWLYCEGVARCKPERREELLSLELPFLLRPEVFADIEYRVDFLVREFVKEVRRAA